MKMNGSRLKGLRIKAGHTQESLAELLDTNPRQIWRWESGESLPKPEYLILIARQLNTTADYLLGLTDDPTIPTQDDLTEEEAALLYAYRRGDVIEFLEIITNKLKKITPA